MIVALLLPLFHGEYVGLVVFAAAVEPPSHHVVECEGLWELAFVLLNVDEMDVDLVEDLRLLMLDFAVTEGRLCARKCDVP